MSFNPINERLSIENFGDDRAVDFELSAGQVIRDGQIVLKGTPYLTSESDVNWAYTNFTQTSDFSSVPDSSAPGAMWRYTSEVYPDKAAVQDFPFTTRFVPREAWVFKEEDVPFYGGAEARRNRRRRVAVLREEDGTAPSNPRGAYGRSIQNLVGEEVIELFSDTSQQVNYIYQNTSDAGQDYFPSNVSNNIGWTIEMRAMVPDSRVVDGLQRDFYQGSSELIVDDGTYRLEFIINSDGMYQRVWNGAVKGAELRLAVPWDKQFNRIRIAAKGSDYYLLSEQGLAYAGTSAFTSASTGAELKLGHMGNTYGLLMVDYLHQSLLGPAVDLDSDVGYIVDSTVEYESLTPALFHQRNVDGFISVIAKSVPPYTGGTTKIHPQYKNTSNPSWTNFGSEVTLNNEYQEIDLSSLPVDNDGTDQIRFKILQQASDTSSRPAPVSELQVLTNFNGTNLRINPEYGPTAGGNTVTLYSDGIVSMASSDRIYVQGVEVDSGDITHISTSEKTFIVPDGQEPGFASVRLVDASTSSYYSDRAYRYIQDYNRGIDRYDKMSAAFGSRSVFRIKNNVPNGEINCAYISSPGLEADSYVSVLDLSYLTEENIVAGIDEPELLLNAYIMTSSASSTFRYDTPPNTDEIVVAGSVAGWEELSVPAPLFFKHLLGKGRYYLKAEQETVNLEELRDMITIHYQDGTAISLEDYPWDVIFSTVDIDGNVLPQNTYSVVIMTGKKFIPGQTVFVSASVVDRADQFRVIHGYTEVINPEKIVHPNNTTQKLNVNITPMGSFNLEITP